MGLGHVQRNNLPKTEAISLGSTFFGKRARCIDNGWSTSIKGVALEAVKLVYLFIICRWTSMGLHCAKMLPIMNL